MRPSWWNVDAMSLHALLKRQMVAATLAVGACAASAQNLVPNGDFETLDEPCLGLPSYLGELNSWVIPSCAATPPNYFNVCSGVNGFPQLSVPANIYGAQDAHSGNAYVGVETYLWGDENDARQYMTAQLSTPLTAGVEYCLTLQVSLCGRSSFASGAMGALFTTSYPSICTYQDTIDWPTLAQITMSLDAVDTTNWTMLSGSYIALGGEEYLTIGNWDTYFNCDTTFLGWIPPFYHAAYYVDDVVLLNCDAGMEDHQGEALTVYPVPADDHLTVQVPTQYLGGTIDVIGLTGTLLSQTHVTSVLMPVPVNELDVGFYLVRLTNGSVTLTTKVIVER